LKARFLIRFSYADLDYQSIFEISRRQIKILVEDWKLFMTFKGISYKKSSRVNVEQVHLNIASATATNDNLDLDQVSTAWILPDIPVSSCRRGKMSGKDNSPLLSMLSSDDLIDISLHGANPCRDQNFDLLLEVMEKFIMEGHMVSFEPFGTDEMYNVLVRKVGLDQFQYLLHIANPIELGQTVNISFPKTETILSGKSYLNSDYAIMHKINECFSTLSSIDLRKVLTWLSDKIHSLPTINVIENDKEQLSDICIQRKRLYWLGRRIFALVGQRHGTADIKLETWRDLSAEEKVECSDVNRKQTKIELKYVLDQDMTCGSQTRNGWSSQANDFFENVISCVSDCVNKALNEEWFPLTDLIKAYKCACDKEPTAVTSHIAISEKIENGHVDEMEVDGITVEMRKHAPDREAIEANTSISVVELSVNLIWQVVNSVLEATRLDLLHQTNTNNLQSVLSSVHSILFTSDAIVPDPLKIKYNPTLSYAVSSIIPDTSYVPNTSMIFLGLVWPVLRKYGWRIIVGSSPNIISFMPKSVSRKRWGEIKQRRDRQSVKLDRDLTYSGFHLIPKTAKRLLLTITSEAVESASDSTINLAYDKNHTVIAVLNKFEAWLLERFDMLNDSTMVTITEDVDSIVVTLGECFDSCAQLLSPITNLSPCWNFDGEPISRPVAAYRCEYLVPFLVNFLSSDALKLIWDTDSNFVDSDAQGLACDLLYFISNHYKDLFDQRFHPPAEEYIDNDDSSLWIEKHIRTLISKRAVSDDPLSSAIDNDVMMGEGLERDETKNASESSKTDLFDVILDDERVLISDFIFIILENTEPIAATESDLRRKSGRLLGAPGLVCRHCLAKHGEGKYFFSSIDSLSTCYPVLEKHYNKCPDCPEAITEKISEARTRHTKQRKTKRCGSQQYFFTKLWNRMVKCKPEIATVQRWAKTLPSTSLTDKIELNTGDIDDNDDDDNRGDGIDDNNSSNNTENDDELIFTDHRDVIDHLRKECSKTLKSNEQQEIQDILDTYYGCIEYAGRIYGTSSMPKHFSTHWLLSKIIGPKDYSNSSNQYVG
jgi:hypothetical protein